MRLERKLPRVNTVSFGFHGARGRQKTMAAADQHNEIELNFVEQGGMVFRHGGDTITLSKNSIAIYWAAIPHQVVAVQPRTEVSWFVVPLAWFLAWKLPREFTMNLLGGGVLTFASTSNFRMPFFHEWAVDFTRSGELRSAAKLEIEAFFRRLSVSWIPLVSSANDMARFGGIHRCRHVERMVSIVTERFREPLSVDEIARLAGLSPEYAMRLFRKWWGLSLWTFLVQQRVAETRRMLLLSDTPITEIAFDCGFQSVSRFYHSFKALCGCSPGVYRRKHADELCGYYSQGN